VCTLAHFNSVTGRTRCYGELRAHTGRTSQRCIVVAADVEKQGVSTDGSVIIAFGIVDSAPTPANKERFGDSKFAPSFGRSGDTTTLYEHLAL